MIDLKRLPKALAGIGSDEEKTSELTEMMFKTHHYPSLTILGDALHEESQKEQNTNSTDKELSEHYELPNYDHQKAVKNYTGGSQLLNHHLFESSGDESKINHEWLRNNSYNTHHIDAALDQIAAPKDFFVYSGIKFNPNEVRKSNGQIHLPAYTSTSLKIRKATNFADSFSDHTNPTTEHYHVLKINIPKGSKHGAYIDNYSNYRGSELEFLMKRNSVIKVDPIPETHVIDNGHERKKIHVWNTHIVESGIGVDHTKLENYGLGESPKSPTSSGAAINDNQLNTFNKIKEIPHSASYINDFHHDTSDKKNEYAVTFDHDTSSAATQHHQAIISNLIRDGFVKHPTTDNTWINHNTNTNAFVWHERTDHPVATLQNHLHIIVDKHNKDEPKPGLTKENVIRQISNINGGQTDTGGTYSNGTETSGTHSSFPNMLNHLTRIQSKLVDLGFDYKSVEDDEFGNKLHTYEHPAGLTAKINHSVPNKNPDDIFNGYIVKVTDSKEKSPRITPIRNELTPESVHDMLGKIETGGKYINYPKEEFDAGNVAKTIHTDTSNYLNHLTKLHNKLNELGFIKKDHPDGNFTYEHPTKHIATYVLKNKSNLTLSTDTFKT